MSFRALLNKQRFLYLLLGLLVLIAMGITAFTFYWLGSSVAGENAPDFATTTLPFLKKAEVVIIEPVAVTDEVIILPINETYFKYVEVTNGCDIHFEGECLLVRAGPGTEFDVVARLRNDMVLRVDGSVLRDGITWYKVIFDEWLRYPERLESDWYVAADFVEVLYDEGDKTIWDKDYVATATTKQITIDLSDQKLRASENGETFMCVDISAGLKLTPTPRGTFTLFKKTPSRYMQGPLPGLASNQKYDLPGVPWNLYFTEGGAVIHGAYWHDSFGSVYSHGCVNLLPEEAKKLYLWAELGMEVIVTE